MLHASEAMRRWSTPCYQLEPMSTCRPCTSVHHPCTQHARQATRRWLTPCYLGGPRSNLQDDDGFAPLHIACRLGRMEVVRALLSAGPKVDLQDLACQPGYMEVLCALLSGGSKVDLQTRQGSSPLYMACEGGHTEVVCALLSGGANVNLQTKVGLSPLHMACEKGYTGVVCALLSRGAKEDPLSSEDTSPLHLACKGGHAEIVHALLSAGAKISLQTKVGATPLHLACIHGHTETVCALISGGAQVDPQTALGWAPLHVACQHGHMRVVRALLSAGARADSRGVNGKTPLDLLPRGLRAEGERLVQLMRAGHRQHLQLCCPQPTARQQASCWQPAKMAVKAPLRVLLACRLRPVAAGLLPGVRAPCAGARHRLHPVEWPSSRRVGAACPCATAHKSVRRRTGGRAATRRHAHCCGSRRRGRRAEGWETRLSCLMQVQTHG